MRRFLIILSLTAIAALTVSAVTADRDHKGSNALTQNVASTPQHQPPHVVPSAARNEDHGHNYTVHDLIAIEDMHGYAVAHFGPCEQVADSFGISEGWEGDWVYRHVHFRLANGASVRICHATNRHDGSRYATAYDEEHQHYARWEQIH
jgi:hypothetical protein